MTTATSADAEMQAPTAESDAEQTSARPWRRAALVALVTWVATYITYGILTLFSWRIPLAPIPDLRHMLGAWNINDVTFYTGIVQGGYHANPQSLAFYPLYPMVSWVADQILPGGPLIACAAVAGICAYFSLMLLYRFVDLEFGASTASRALLYFAAFPVAFYLYNAYNTSMFVLLSIGALYAARRSHWWLAGTLAGLAGATRLFGLLLAAPLAYEYLRQCGWNVRRIRWNVLSLGIIPLGLLAFAVYCRISFGNWLAFVDAQASWKRTYVWPGQSMYEALKYLITQGPRSAAFAPSEYYLITAFETATVLFSLVLVILGFVGPWKIRRDQYFLLIAALVPIILVTATKLEDVRWFVSAPRFALEWLAPFVILARIGRNQFVDRLYLMVGFTLQAAMFATVALHTNWVA